MWVTPLRMLCSRVAAAAANVLLRRVRDCGLAIDTGVPADRAFLAYRWPTGSDLPARYLADDPDRWVVFPILFRARGSLRMNIDRLLRGTSLPPRAWVRCRFDVDVIDDVVAAVRATMDGAGIAERLPCGAAVTVGVGCGCPPVWCHGSSASSCRRSAGSRSPRSSGTTSWRSTKACGRRRLAWWRRPARPSPVVRYRPRPSGDRRWRAHLRPDSGGAQPPPRRPRGAVRARPGRRGPAHLRVRRRRAHGSLDAAPLGPGRARSSPSPSTT